MIEGVALVTGAGGQDGSYLVERLVKAGYAVHAVLRPGPPSRVAGSKVRNHLVDLADRPGLHALVEHVEPTEIYHLGGVSSVAASWASPLMTSEVTGLSSVALMQAALELQERVGRPVRFVQASSAEIFGEPSESPQDERTPLQPVSPYGASKAFAHLSISVYRSRGLDASSLILYNHESPRRPPTFVTRKITQGVARIAKTGQGTLAMGNLDARRDWGWAPDYVEAMTLAAKHPADDFVVATGVAHSVRDFVAEAFGHVGIDDWERHVTVDPAFYRPSDPTVLLGNSHHAQDQLGWRPTVAFGEIIAAMVDHDMANPS